jgi:hypothetical protein
MDIEKVNSINEKILVLIKNEIGKKNEAAF